MALADVFNPEIAQGLIARIENLKSDTQALWGKMNSAQMLAHCNVTYDYVYAPEKFKKPSGFFKWVLKNFVKKGVVSEKPYAKNMRTGPDFLVSDQQDFQMEKEKLIKHIQKVVEEGRQNFDGRISNSFGRLNADEWNNMFYKHLDHHLSQFGL